ncbi:MAG: hypothetical protein E7660_01445 [Ruminococcaceae bacterium]|nr:hypothetical protein [Oscillospiraceae bacterium]
MKKLLRTASFLLCLILLCPILATDAYALEEIIFTEIETVDVAEFRYGASALPMAVQVLDTEVTEEYSRYGKLIISQMANSDNLLAAYELIASGIESLNSKIYLSNYGAKINKNEFLTVYNIVLNDYPEYFWTGSSCSYATSFMGSYISYIAPEYVMTASDAEAATDKLNKAVSNFAFNLESKSDYKISKYLHDRLAMDVEYVATDLDQTAYGALVEKKAVCAGYSRAYQLLLTSLGIPAWTVTGSSYIPGTTETALHAWNIVFLDGEWYYTDITWDDQGDTTELIFYSYFNVTSEQLFEDHTPDTDIAPYLPDCTATKNNYFKKKGWECETFDQTTVTESILSCGGYSRIYYTGDIDEFVNELGSSMYDIAVDIGISGSYSRSIIRLGHEIHVIINSGYPANGDTNGDLDLTVKDSLLLKKFLAGSEDITEISIRNADMNGDGEITSRDIIMIKKLLMGI